MAPCLCHRLSRRISCDEPPHSLIGKLRGLVILSQAFVDHHTAVLAISELTITTCSAGVLYPSSFRWTLSGAHMEPPRCCRLLQGLNTLMCLSPKLKSFRFLLHCLQRLVLEVLLLEVRHVVRAVAARLITKRVIGVTIILDLVPALSKIAFMSLKVANCISLAPSTSSPWMVVVTVTCPCMPSSVLGRVQHLKRHCAVLRNLLQGILQGGCHGGHLHLDGAPSRESPQRCLEQKLAFF